MSAKLTSKRKVLKSEKLPNPIISDILIDAAVALRQRLLGQIPTTVPVVGVVHSNVIR